MIVTIDGTSASGKSTTAKEVARKLGFVYIDTGAMYRAVALYCIENRIDIHNRKAVADVSHKIDIRFEFGNDKNRLRRAQPNRIFLNNREVTNLIRTEAAGSVASTIATYKDVRSNLVEKQRKMGRKENLICEGRDIRTVVFKDADIKIYMDADLMERARRRQKELGGTADLQSVFGEQFGELTAEPLSRTVIESLKKRDKQDKMRAESPLKIPEDAVIIDTTHLSIEDEVEKVIEMIRQYER